jgi:hypothetical protein
LEFFWGLGLRVWSFANPSSTENIEETFFSVLSVDSCSNHLIVGLVTFGAKDCVTHFPQAARREKAHQVFAACSRTV